MRMSERPEISTPTTVKTARQLDSQAMLSHKSPRVQKAPPARCCAPWAAFRRSLEENGDEDDVVDARTISSTVTSRGPASCWDRLSVHAEVGLASTEHARSREGLDTRRRACRQASAIDGLLLGSLLDFAGSLITPTNGSGHPVTENIPEARRRLDAHLSVDAVFERGHGRFDQTCWAAGLGGQTIPQLWASIRHNTLTKKSLFAVARMGDARERRRDGVPMPISTLYFTGASTLKLSAENQSPTSTDGPS